MNPNPENSRHNAISEDTAVSHPAKKSAVPLVLSALAIGALSYGLGRRSAPEAPTEPTSVPAKSDESASGAKEESNEEEKPSTIQFDEESSRIAGLQVRPVSLSQLAMGVPFNGQIAPNPNGVVRVASIVPGRVTRLFVSVGDNVQQGQTLAIIESRAIGEAQSAYQQAVARLQNARANFGVVTQQARAGVFSRAPIEAARRAQVDAQADVRAQGVALRQSQVALENARRLASSGSFASPALEAARAQSARATEAFRSAQAALSNGEASVRSTQNELARRRQIAASGGYASRLVEEAHRVLVAAQSARATAQSEVATTRANLSRARTLAAEGLVSQRDLETAQQAFETAQARLETSQSDETAASREVTRQSNLASTNVAGTAEVSAAQSALAAAQADVRTRRAEVERAREEVRLANVALSRERANFRGNIANRREISTVESSVSSTRNALLKARQTLSVANDAYEREQRIFRQNLNNTAQIQAARSTLVQAQSDLAAARTTLSLFKSAPGGRASVPIVAPISGVVQERKVAQGEVLEADSQLMTLVNLNSVAVEAAIYEKDFAQVRVGAPVSANVDAFPGRKFEGRIAFIGSQLDPETRTLTARALLENRGGLRPGMFVRGQISTATGRLAVSVPSDAVQTMEGKTVVFVATEKANEFSAREVKTGATTGAVTEIKSGLKPGEKIVVKGAFVVKSQAMKSELAEE